jgi:16S rRNA (uracil1498-N3)-methyltransferase
VNLLLLLPENMLTDTCAEVSGRQLAHLHSTLTTKEGDHLCVGLLNGRIGSALVTTLTADIVRLEVDWHASAPSALPLTLIIGLPRPKMLKRIIQTATTMGIKELYFIHSWKVEKSFWQSPWLNEEKIRENCILGLEQAKDTIMPTIHLRKRFKPFVEDELPAIALNTRKLLAHPGESTPCPIDIQDKTTLVIGPEGGFTPYEVEKIKECGFQSVHLGERILRVETAVPALVARLFCP